MSNVHEMDMADEVSATNTDSFSNTCTSQSTIQLSSCNDRVSVDSSGQSAYVACPECGIVVDRKNFAGHRRRHHIQSFQFTPTSTVSVPVINQSQAYPLSRRRKSVKVTCSQCGIVLLWKNFTRHRRRHHTQASQFNPASAVPVPMINQSQTYPLPGSRISVNVKCSECGMVILRRSFARHRRRHHTQASQFTSMSAVPVPVAYPLSDIRTSVNVECSECGMVILRTSFARHCQRRHTQASQFTPESAVPVPAINQSQAYPLSDSRTSINVKCSECGMVILRRSFARHCQRHHTQASQFTPESPVPVPVINQSQAYPLSDSRTSINVKCSECGMVILRRNFARHCQRCHTQASQFTDTSSPVETPQEHSSSREPTVTYRRPRSDEESNAG